MISSSKIPETKKLNMLWPILIFLIFNRPFTGKAEELKMVESGATEVTDCLEVKPTCPNGNLKFFLYTRTTQDSPYEIIDRIEEAAKIAPFMQNAPFKLLVHAFNGNKNSSPNKEIRPALFEEGDYNVISVDWSPFAKVLHTAVPAVNIIGNCTACFLNWLFNVRSDVLSANKTHVIGLSMGALIAGAIGKNIQQFGYKLSWITALDPANLAYFNLPIVYTSVVNANIAIFVDSIHTNVNKKGLCGPTGHVDFYINNGYIQPGCDPSNTSCSHIYAAVIYGRTIRPSVKYYGVTCNLTPQCNSATGACIPNNYYNQLMGFYVPHTARGVYQVTSN